MSALVETLRRAETQIARYGWYGVRFPATAEGPGWEHSIGFTQRLGAPEIVVFGLDYEVSHALLWGVYRAFERGERIEDGTVHGRLIKDLDCQFRRVHPWYAAEHLFAAQTYYDRRRTRRPFAALQVIWPDQHGYFPWEDECHPDIAALQPLLYRTPADLYDA